MSVKVLGFLVFFILLVAGVMMMRSGGISLLSSMGILISIVAYIAYHEVKDHMK